MSDDPGLGELARRIADDRESARRNSEAIDKRITELAAATVPGGVYQADRRWLDDRFATLQSSIDALARTVTAQQTRAASQRLVLLTGLLFPIIVAIATAVIFSLKR